MKDSFFKIINHYGVDNQKRKFSEEADELRDAIVEYEKMKGIVSPTILNNQYKEHIVEEIGDVCVMLHQFVEYYEIKPFEIYRVMEQKIDRQFKRMEEENEYRK